MTMLRTTDLTSAVVSALLAQKYTDQINRTVVLWNLLPHKRTGDPLAWVLKTTGRTAVSALAETAAAPTATTHNRPQATLAMGEYADTASVTGRAQAAVASAMNPEAPGGPDIVMDEVRDAIDNIAVKVAADLYAGNGSSNNINGLASAVDSTGTYAGVDPATYTGWVSTEQTEAAADLAFASFRDLDTAIYTACGRRPDLRVTTPTIFNSVVDLYSAYPQYVDKVTTARGQMTLKSGARALMVEGVPLVEDPHCTASTIYALNTEFVDLCYMPGYDSPLQTDDIIQVVKSLTGDTMSAEQAAAISDRAMNGGIAPVLKKLGRTGNQESWEAIVYCQIRVRRRNAHGKLTIT